MSCGGCRRELSPEERMLEKALKRKREKEIVKQIQESETVATTALDRSVSKQVSANYTSEDDDDSIVLEDHEVLDTLSSLSVDSPGSDMSLSDYAFAKPKLSPVEVRKYFGNPARNRFFKHYQWLSKQQRLQSLPKTIEEDTELCRGAALVFDNTDDPDSDMFRSCREDECVDAADSIDEIDAKYSEKTQALVNTLRAITPDVYNLPQQGSGMTEPTSPRSKYIMGCLFRKINPRASLIIRKKLTRELHLEHYGIGDEMAQQVAASLIDLPFVSYLNICDNNLTDAGLRPILDAVMTMPNLLELNLSENIIGPLTADAMSTFLSRRPVCPLERLILRKANVDDYEGERFVQALIGNDNFVGLDLSQNQIGDAELLNTVKPNLITATEALASLLRSPTCKLEELKVSWNMIRLDSGVDFARSLSVNRSLTYLDVSYNSLGHSGGIALGDALLDNKVLSTILLANNNIDAMACFVICVAVEQNPSLRRLSLDGNPIGEQGAQCVMNVPSVVGCRVEITAANCNTALRSVDELAFDYSNTCREYTLDMADSVQRAVAFKLLHIVANHPSYVFSKFSYAPSTSKKTSSKLMWIPLDLKQVMIKDKVQYFTDDEREILENLEKLRESARSSERAKLLFNQFDIDNSGEIDKDELFQLMKSIGLDIDETEIEDMMAMFDINGDGTIELPEFINFIKYQYKSAIARIRDMTESPAMVLSSDLSRTHRYVPPRTGILHIEVVDGFVLKEHFQVITSTIRRNSTNVARNMGDVASLLSFVVQNSKLRLGDAFSFYETMYADMGDKARVLAKILPQMASATEARMLVSKVTNDDNIEATRIKQVMGQSLRPIFGLVNGYYCLDLSKENDRTCLSKLLEISKTENQKRKSASKLGYGRVGDTSQKRNWSCFRNSLLDGNPVVITIQMFTPMPKFGRLEFDFCNIARPSWGQQALSDVKCVKVLINLSLIYIDDKDEALRVLRNMRQETTKCIRDYRSTHFACTESKAQKIGIASRVFYESVPVRQSYLQEGLKKEEIKVDFTSNTSALLIHRAHSSTSCNSFMRQNSDSDDRKDNSPVELNGVQSVNVLDDYSANVEQDPVIPCDGHDQKPPKVSKSDKRHDCQTKMRRRLRLLIQSEEVSESAKASRIVERMEDALGPYWIRCRHLAFIISKFSHGKVEKARCFGSYRVEVVVTFFEKLIDIYNFELVLRELSASETACVYCRLGWLNIYNPMKPEGSYELNLGTWEERQVAKSLIILAMAEPGENILGERFRWDAIMDPTPGWTITQPWLTDDGMAKKGILNLTFCSAESRGCKPDIVMRRSLMQMVLCDEYDICEEDDVNVPDPSQRVGEQYMVEKQEKW
eukprot:CAMPEP_0185021358 /NCGR_PEP_ID=MMETSP1103-20130426/4051_1 /TAXON_ID=36769 /ORGANISM="Paraphysomonas bandaiensis, Strain Caron Lab Isolate" /LENGTH=1351 /DNA_ID=CAMNT_0027552843 /DNA_START=296 /DNA_END=4348 /DNA_ORIENTATION=+